MDVILIPAYNEEKNIGKVISRLKKFRRFKLIVVDDGSGDRTFYIANRLGAEVIRHEKRKGKGDAIKTGFNHIIKNYPQTKHIILIDADMQYLPEEVEKLLIPLQRNEADFVTGYRDWKKIPFRHRLGNFVWRTTFNLFFGKDFKDTSCGYVAMNRKAMRKIKNVYGGYILESSMFTNALKGRLRIKQVPVTVLYKKKRQIPSGIRIVLGVWFFIIKEGFKYRLNLD